MISKRLFVGLETPSRWSRRQSIQSQSTLSHLQGLHPTTYYSRHHRKPLNETTVPIQTSHPLGLCSCITWLVSSRISASEGCLISCELIAVGIRTFVLADLVTPCWSVGLCHLGLSDPLYMLIDALTEFCGTGLDDAHTGRDSAVFVLGPRQGSLL